MSNYHYTFLATTKDGWGAGRSLKSAVTALFSDSVAVESAYKYGYTVVQFDQPTPLEIVYEESTVRPTKEVRQVNCWKKQKRPMRLVRK